MQPSELRINNIINGIYHNFSDEDEDIELETICKVITLDETGSLDYPIYVESDEDIEQFSQFQGIPLTEEWLKKFCFISEDVRYTAWKKSSFFLNINRYGEYIFKAESAEYQIKYVHQLQNLFSCLLGMELIAEEFVYISKAEQ